MSGRCGCVESGTGKLGLAPNLPLHDGGAPSGVLVELMRGQLGGNAVDRPIARRDTAKC